MKALTISQPYASLIAYGDKWVENRRWPTKYRGPLAIHAGKGTQYMTRREMEEERLPTGCIVAIVDLVNCVPLDWAVDQLNETGDFKVGPGELYRLSSLLNHEHTEGPYCWILGNQRHLRPVIEVTGQLGLWDLPPDVDDRCQRQIDRLCPSQPTT